jgi:hypothetical protein
MTYLSRTGHAGPAVCAPPPGGRVLQSIDVCPAFGPLDTVMHCYQAGCVGPARRPVFWGGRQAARDRIVSRLCNAIEEGGPCPITWKSTSRYSPVA